MQLVVLNTIFRSLDSNPAKTRRPELSRLTMSAIEGQMTIDIEGGTNNSLSVVNIILEGDNPNMLPNYFPDSAAEQSRHAVVHHCVHELAKPVENQRSTN